MQRQRDHDEIRRVRPSTESPRPPRPWATADSNRSAASRCAAARPASSLRTQPRSRQDPRRPGADQRRSRAPDHVGRAVDHAEGRGGEQQRQAAGEVVDEVAPRGCRMLAPAAAARRRPASSMRSQKSAKTSRSRARNRPSIAPSSASISATKSRARGTSRDGDRAGGASASSSAIQNEMPVAPKWKAAVNGRESQRTLHSCVPAARTVAIVMPATIVPKRSRKDPVVLGQRRHQRGGGERQENRYHHERRHRTTPVSA